MPTQFQIRRDTAFNWSNLNPILAEGEFAFETDTNRLKVGNGVENYNDLIYVTDLTANENSVTTRELAVDGNGLIGQLLASEGDGTFAWRDSGGLVINDDNEIDFEQNLVMSRVENGTTFNGYIDSNSLTFNPSTNILNVAGRVESDLKGSVQAADGTTLIDSVDKSFNLDQTVKGNIVPDANEVYDLGSETLRFRDIYLSGNTIDLGGTLITSDGIEISLPETVNITGDLSLSNIRIKDNFITTTDSNSSLELRANGTGKVEILENELSVGNVSSTGAVSVAGQVDINSQTSVASLNVEDLTTGRVLLSGINGELEDSANLTFNGTNLSLSGNQTITGTINVVTGATLASVNIEDLTNGRVVLAGNNGELEDSANLTFNGSVLNVGGSINATTNLDVGGTLTIANNYALPTTDGTIGQVLTTDGQGNLSFAGVDTFGGNRVYVSSEKGNDANDGINSPVASVKRAAEIAASLVYDSSGNTVGNISIMISSGDYTEDNPIIVSDNVSIQGDNLRRTIIRPQNKDRDIFRVRNSAYINNLVFRDALNAGVPDFTFRYAVTFDDVNDTSVSRTNYVNLPSSRPKIFTSPYIQNCSVISFLAGGGVEIDGNLIDTPNTPPNNIEAENPVDTADGIPEQGKSMVANAFTILSFGGNAWRVINDAYAQIVSCFVIFTENGCIAQNGGYLSITNSASNFGLFALRASGYSQNSFEFDRGIISGNGLDSGFQTLDFVGLDREPLEQFVIRIRDNSDVDITDTFNSNSSLGIQESLIPTVSNVGGSVITFDSAHGFSGGDEVAYDANGNREIVGLLDEMTYFISVPSPNQIQLYHDQAQTKPIRNLDASLTSGTHFFKTGFEEFFIREVVSTHNIYQTLTLPTASYSITPGDTITASDGSSSISATIWEYNSVNNELTVSINLVQEGGNQVRNLFSTNAVIDAGEIDTGTVNIISVSNRSDLYSATVKVQSTQLRQMNSIGSTVLKKVRLHRPSIVNSSAHTWEYAGSGTDYNALPQNGGQTDEFFEQVSTLPGRVYTSGTNELGDFKVGDFVQAFNRTGNITFKNKVEVGELDSLALSLSSGIVVDEISIDTDLGDNEVGGPNNNRLVTQLAARSFIDNRLGNFIDQNLSTNAVPNAALQLNGQGKINADVIPPTSETSAFRLESYEERLSLHLDQPPVDLKSGDIVIEEYQQISISTTGTITIQKDEVITQANSGATGVVKESVTNGSTLRLIEPFSGTFNTTDELSGSVSGSLGANSVPLTVSGPNEETDNYFLTTSSASQILVLQDGPSYSFSNAISNSTPVVGAITGATATATEFNQGVLTVLDVLNLSGGSGYQTPGTYTDVPLTNISGTGTGATAEIVVNPAGSVDSIDLRRGGSGYSVGDTVSALASNIGGISGTGTEFTVDVLAIEDQLSVDINPSVGLPFSASSTNPEFIADDNATSQAFDQTGDSTLGFDAADQGTGGNVNYTQSEIDFGSNHGYSNGDPVIYNSGANPAIGGLTNNDTYYVEVIDATKIQLYNDYSLNSKIDFLTSSTGVHQLIIDNVNLDRDTVFVSSHGLSTGDAIKYASSTPPTGINDGDYLFVGSVTVNSFTLHDGRGDALGSINGLTVNPVNLSADGSGTATLTRQNVVVENNFNTSGKDTDNWSSLTTSTIDASGIVSGLIDSSRLATGSANNRTFLRGDSTWSEAVQGITSDPGITLTGLNFTDGADTVYYDRVNFKVETASYDNPLSPSSGTETKGIAAFDFNHFQVDANGLVTTKPSGNGGVLDAATLAGESPSYYLNPDNLSSPVAVEKGGTNSNSYSQGDILYAATNIGDGTFSDVISGLSIGSQNDVLNVDAGGVPAWTSSPTFTDLTVDNVQLISGTNGITTTSGNLVLTASSGTVNITAGLNVTGSQDISGSATPGNVTFTITDGTNNTFEVDSATGNTSIGGALSVAGNLTVNGTTTTVNSTTVTVDDPIFSLGGDTPPSSDDNKDRGIEFRWHDGIGSKLGFFGFDDSTGKFTFIPDASNSGEVFSGSLGEVDAQVDWNNVLNKPDPTLTITGDINGTATFNNLGDATLTASFGTITLGTNTSGNYVQSVSTGVGLAGGAPGAEGADLTLSLNHLGIENLTDPGDDRILFWDDSSTQTDWLNIGTGLVVFGTTIQHGDTSSVANLASDNSSTTFIQDVNFEFDTFGHVTAASVNTATALTSQSNDFGTVTIDDTDTEYSWTQTGSIFANNVGATLTVVSGLGVDVDVDQASDAIRITNTDLGSSQNIFKNVAIFQNDLTPINSLSATSNNDTLNIVEGNAGLSLSDDGANIFIGHANTSSVTNVSSQNSGGTFIQDIDLQFDTYGHVTSATVGTGTALISQSNDFGTVTVDDTDTEYTWSGTGSASADTVGDNLTLVGGSGINIDVDSGNDAIRVSCAGSVTFTGLAVTGNTTLGNSSGDAISVTGSVNTNILPDSNGTRNIGAGGTRWNTVYANIFNGTATSAKYADLAEVYETDQVYPAGTVVMFGGEREVTATDSDSTTKVLGVISQKPAYLMNKDANGQAVALKGRVPCYVIGKAKAGDILVSSSTTGVARSSYFKGGAVIGKIIQDKESEDVELVEIYVS